MIARVGTCVVLAVAHERKRTVWAATPSRRPGSGTAAGVDQETSHANVAYARFPHPEPTAYRAGWLPD